MPYTSQLLIQDDDGSSSSFASSPHKLSWEDSPMIYSDEDYPHEDSALVTRSHTTHDNGDEDDRDHN
jgi:hypothetical protein